ncbi:MAG: hypothetical protein DRN95_09370, partial [Candidatus Hydrothermarchaeota archaeon]
MPSFISLEPEVDMATLTVSRYGSKEFTVRVGIPKGALSSGYVKNFLGAEDGLYQLKISATPVEDKLSQVRVATLYERIGDGKWINRTVGDEIEIFKDTKTDLVFRAFWRWNPCPETCENLPEKARRLCELRGYSYQHLEEAIKEIKLDLPELVVCGAVPAQIIQRDIVWNPKTGETLRYPETWELALDPGKWGLTMSKEELQCRFAKTHFWVPEDLDCEKYRPEIASAYFPDLTNPKFQELLLSWAERQIDAGVDAIWIDMLFKQVTMLYQLTKDFNHPAVKESYEAVQKIVEEIKEYGEKEKREQIFVGSWSTAAYLPYPPPDLDFVTITPSSREVREMQLDEEKWDERLRLIRDKFGDIPIFAFIDWAGTTKTPLGQFSQVLTREEQREFLRLADKFFSKKNVVFVYPVHGGYMGRDATILSYGKSRVYDSLAPEFETYETIKELAQSKKVGSGKTQSVAQSVEPPSPVFPVVPSNSHLTDPVALEDFVPFGVALEKLPDNRIVINREQGWTASNFVPFGMCWDGENTLVFHSSVNIGGGHLRLMFNGERLYRFLQGPSYYDETGRYFPYPTVYTNPHNDFVNIIAYDEETRTWYHKILDLRVNPPREILFVKGRGRLAPLWIGKPRGPFVVHGVAGVKDGWLMLDTWGGYLDFEEVLECRFHHPRT